MEDEIRRMLIDSGVSENIIDSSSYDDEIDSIIIANLIISIEDTYGIEIDGEDIIPENFVDLTSICNMVKRYLGAK